MATTKIQQGAIASDAITSADLGDDITLSGDYVKVPVGTTATRPSGASAGYIRFNTTEGTLEQYDGSAWSQMPKPPIISTLSYPNSASAVTPDGGDVITISGSNFETGVNVFFRSSTYTATYATSVTRTNSTSLSVTTPALTAGDYDVIVEQADGTQAILTSGLTSNATPSFSTASGSLGNINNGAAISKITIVASEADSGDIVYTVTTGSLPTGLALDSSADSAGTISGTPTGYTAETTVNFTITATDDENQTTTRNFSLTVLVNFYNYAIDQSLRFNDNDSPYLSRTPSSAGNRKTWTWSGWVKRGNIGINTSIFSAGTVEETRFTIRFTSNDQLYILDQTSATYQTYLLTTQKFRDTSSWYHIVFAVDSTQGTASNRERLYINGEEVTAWDNSDYVSQNADFHINNSIRHNIAIRGDVAEYFEGYLAEFHLVDGSQLSPTSFGETKEGVWVPIEYSGSYGTNGFYLPFKQDYSVEGFSSTLYQGDGDSNTIVSGVGFSPDLVWVKNRGASQNHRLWDTVRGVNKALRTNERDGEYTGTSLTSFNTDGFTIGNSDADWNGSGAKYVAWCWDMGDSSVSNTNGSVTSTVRANSTYGQSIVSFTGTGAVLTAGHGLSQAPEVIIVKNRDITDNTPNDGNWRSYFKYLTPSSPELYKINFNTDGALTSGISNWNNTAPTSTVFTVGTDWELNQNGQNAIAYCFHSVDGYSKFGSYTGTGSTGNSITTGFEPALVIIKRTDATNDWYIMDNVRTDTQGRPHVLQVNTTAAETTEDSITFDSNGFTIDVTNNALNASSGDYIYMAFADKREYAYWLDQSGNNNDFTSNNLTESDVSVDSPTNNFATFNPLMGTSCTYTEGNLRIQTPSSQSEPSGYGFGTMVMNSTIGGKWYWEIWCDQYNPYSSDHVFRVGIHAYNGASGQNYHWYRGYDAGPALEYNGGTHESLSNGGIPENTIIGVAYDADSRYLTFYQNGSQVGSQITSNIGDEDWFPHFSDGSGGNYGIVVANFGQDSSFAGNKVSQGNTDGNGIGDFYYTPPTGYLALCNENLPNDDTFELLTGEKPSDYFNTVLYTGNNLDSQSITGVGFQPDFVWIKERDSTSDHFLMDAVRGATKFLQSSDTIAEVDNSDVLQSFDSDGFTVGTSGGTNANNTYVAWNWKAGGTPVSNTDGSITSSVSASTTAGFSIVSYTGTGSNATVGHGLSQAPEMVIVKNRDNTAQPESWPTYSAEIGATKYLFLNETNAAATYSLMWNDTAPTSSVFSVGTYSGTNYSGDALIAYCWHSVPGFSKFGSYTGNGSGDGPFVYTGFRPAWVMIKRTDSANYWMILDNKRNTYNPANTGLYPNLADAESNFGNSTGIDFVSNGFKHKDNVASTNASGGTYIYMAIAEDPFKYGNAR